MNAYERFTGLDSYSCKEQGMWVGEVCGAEFIISWFMRGMKTSVCSSDMCGLISVHSETLCKRSG